MALPLPHFLNFHENLQERTQSNYFWQALKSKAVSVMGRGGVRSCCECRADVTGRVVDRFLWKTSMQQNQQQLSQPRHLLEHDANDQGGPGEPVSSFMSVSFTGHQKRLHAIDYVPKRPTWMGFSSSKRVWQRVAGFSGLVSSNQAFWLSKLIILVLKALRRFSHGQCTCLAICTQGTITCETSLSD